MTVLTAKLIAGIIKVDTMSAQLYWIALDCTGVPNKVIVENLQIYLVTP